MIQQTSFQATCTPTACKGQQWGLLKSVCAKPCVCVSLYTHMSKQTLMWRIAFIKWIPYCSYYHALMKGVCGHSLELLNGVLPMHYYFKDLSNSESCRIEGGNILFTCESKWKYRIEIFLHKKTWLGWAWASPTVASLDTWVRFTDILNKNSEIQY